MEVYSLAFIIGAIFGSFLNVAIVRLPKGSSIVTPRSFCPSCKQSIKWYHNIPLLSFLLLRGKCAYCGIKINLQYFFVELVSAFITLFIVLKVGISLDFLFTTLLFYVLIVLAFIDLEYKAVPDYLLLVALLLVFFSTSFTFLEALRNATIFAGFFALLEFIMTFYIQNIKAKILKDDSLKSARSLGEGDIPIVAIIGAFLGIQAGVVAIFLAAVFAIIPAVYYNIKKKEAQLPFIPYLLLGLITEYFLQLSKGF